MDTKVLKNVYIWFIGAFLMPPMAWLFLAWFAQIWNFSELIQIVASFPIWIYSFAFLGVAVGFLHYKLKIISRFIKSGNPGSIKLAMPVINSLPGLFSFGVIIYIAIGPFVVLYGMDFISTRELWLAEAIGLPIIFLFAAPFYIQFLKSIELATKGLKIADSYFLYKIRGKMTMTLGFTNVGIIALLAVIAVSVVNYNHALTGDDIFQRLLFKNVIGGIIAFIVQMMNIFFIIKMVNRPINLFEGSLDSMLKDIDNGVADLTVSIDRSTLDELGVITAKFNNLILNIKNLINNIKENAAKLSYASDNLTVTSSELSKQADGMSSQSAQVASAAEQMDMNMNTMAATTEEMSMNISSVSSASEEMSKNIGMLAETVEMVSASMDGISTSASESHEISANAETLAVKAISTMEILDKAANEIGVVTDMIKRVAEKTNLLALNATIEAASAGDAGKGFAVVASEIKELANQSADAAEDIAQKIEGVQTNTSNTNEAIRAVSSIISQISKSSEEINISVKQQATAMENISTNISETENGVKNIARSVHELTIGSNEVSSNAQEAAKGVSNIAENIQTMNSTLINNKTNTGKLNFLSTELFGIAEHMVKSVSLFVIDEVEVGVTIQGDNLGVEEIQKSILAHTAKGGKLENMLNGGPVVLPIDSHHCAFAKWYYGQGSEKWKHLPEYLSIEEPHEKIHKLMQEVYNLHQANDIDLAREKMSQWESLSNQIKTTTNRFLNLIQNNKA